MHLERQIIGFKHKPEIKYQENSSIKIIKSMKQQFLCLSNSNYRDGRILTVLPLPQKDNDHKSYPAISYLIAPGTRMRIPTGLVVDVQALDILEVDVIAEAATKPNTLIYDPWSLKIPSRLNPQSFTNLLANKLIANKEADTKESDPPLPQLVFAEECTLDKSQSKQPKAKPKVNFRIGDQKFHGFSSDAALQETYRDGNSAIQSPRNAFMVLQGKDSNSASSPHILGFIFT